MSILYICMYICVYVCVYVCMGLGTEISFVQ